MIEIVDSPDFSRRLGQEDTGDQGIHDEIQRVEKRMRELAEAWAESDISSAEWSAARARLKSRLNDLRGRLGEVVQESVLDRWTELSLAGEWDGLSLDQRRAITSAVLDRVVVGRFDKTLRPRFDERRVVIERKL